MNISKIANLKFFYTKTRKISFFLSAFTLILFCIGIYWGLFIAPTDYLQGNSYRIMYVHVPPPWMAMMVYLSMTIMSVFALVWRHPLADILSKCSAPIGASFTLIALVTGSIWGKPTWGTWWVWDARLTSVFILFLIYMGHITLVRSFEDEYKGARAGAILTLIGAFNLPIIKFSVDWWNTLHQPATISKLSAPSIHISMLTPLMIMTFAYLLFLITLFLIRFKIEILEQKISRAKNI